ncbi:MAG: MATE family efflux transporter [Mycoplasmatota bacterium]|nr:MATE family efflux transporter [Mycoplasmatota bacterium]
MKEEQQNKMAIAPMNKLILKMGLPMIVSMVLQALYNVIDSIFVANMGSKGAIANQALTYAFPIQIMIIAIGVGTGVGLNALLSKSLGENDTEKVNKIAGNGIFLSICIYIIFLLFGLFYSKQFISLFTNDKEIIDMGTTYLRICTCLSLGSIGYTVYERFLQATGKTMLSTISQISGAVANIILDYLFIYPFKMGVAGAAWATVIGQFISLFIAMYFHYKKNNEINSDIKYITPDINLIKGIYSIGISAALMQALLAVMMAGMNAILGLAQANQTVLISSFGIYYKIQQIALFSAFGLSNTIISILSFNYGMQDKKRIDDCIKYGIIDTIIVTLIISILFEIFAYPLAKLFGLTGGTTKEIINVCTTALKISSMGFVFMGISVAVQGILQSIRYALRPLIISLLRLVIFVFPIAFLFTKLENVTELVWWTFPIAEGSTAIISLIILKDSYNKKIKVIKSDKIKSNLIISISREHGTNGKEIGKLVAKELNIPFYDKEEIKDYALKNNIINSNYSNEELYEHFLSLDASEEAIINQSKVIKNIANNGNAVIIGRATDYILKENKNLIKIFIYAPMDYKIKNIMKNYGDNKKQAKSHILNSNKLRSNYYSVISNKTWGDKNNYDLCIDSKIGNENVVKIICDYVKNI